MQDFFHQQYNIMCIYYIYICSMHILFLLHILIDTPENFSWNLQIRFIKRMFTFYSSYENFRFHFQIPAMKFQVCNDFARSDQFIGSNDVCTLLVKHLLKWWFCTGWFNPDKMNKYVGLFILLMAEILHHLGCIKPSK